MTIPGLLQPTYMLDATCELLADAPAPLETRQRVRLHVGTSEVMARVHPVIFRSTSRPDVATSGGHSCHTVSCGHKLQQPIGAGTGDP